MAAFSAKRIGNWTFSVAGHVFPLEADLVGRVKQTVPNRADRRRAERCRRPGPELMRERGVTVVSTDVETVSERPTEPATPAVGGDRA